MKKKDKESTFEPRRLDDLAVEVSPGLVQIDGLPDLIPLEAYQEGKKEELKNLQRQEMELRKKVTSCLKQSLNQVREASGPCDWPTFLRRLSWTLGQANYDITIPTGMAKTDVEKYQLSDYIRACLYIFEGRELFISSAQGTMPPIISIEPEEDLRLSRKVKLWTAFLKLFKEVKRIKPILTQDGQKEDILTILKRLEEKIDKLSSNGFGKKK